MHALDRSFKVCEEPVNVSDIVDLCPGSTYNQIHTMSYTLILVIRMDRGNPKIIFRIPPEDRERIRRECARDGDRSMSSLIRSILMEGLERRERERQEADIATEYA